MHFHAQNLNEKPDGATGSILRHGRCWLHFSERLSFMASWNFQLRGPRLGVEFGGYNGEDVLISVGLGFVSLWLGVEGLRWKWLPRGKRCEVYWFENALWIKPWSRQWEWRTGDPWWIHGLTIHFDDLLLGRAKYSKRTLSEHDVLIPMPEGSYPARVKMEVSTWKRPRWFARTVRYADVDLPTGIPFQGKGENGWDCGEDGLYGSSMPADTVEEAIGKTVASVLKSRRKYGNVRNLPPVLSPRVKVPEENPTP